MLRSTTGLFLHFHSGTDHRGKSSDLCHLREIMREKLGTMPPPSVEPEAWERLWMKHPRSWKQLLRAFVQKMARGAEGVSFCANTALGTSVCSDADMEFLCPDCPAEARTWPNRAALRSHMMSKHGWRTCRPVCRTQFHSRARAVHHLANRAERCRQAIQEDPDHFSKLEAAVQEKLEQQDQQERRKAVEQGRSWLAAFQPAVRSESHDHL